MNPSRQQLNAQPSPALPSSWAAPTAGLVTHSKVLKLVAAVNLLGLGD